jgi:hypothetical protein
MNGFDGNGFDGDGDGNGLRQRQVRACPFAALRVGLRAR